MDLPATTTALITHLMTLDGISAIGIGGSRASGTAEAGSDIDIYVLTREQINPEDRRRIIASLTSDQKSVEIANPFWGDEDGVALDGIWHDIVYFDAAWFFNEIDATLTQHRAREGYSTSFVFTLVNMVAIHDPDELLAAWKQLADAYPDKLAEAIINHNYQVSCEIHACYRNQIARAVELNDPVAANHRVAAFLACAFDIAFASLRLWHPGEKRQLQHLRTHDFDLPANFENHIRAVLSATTPFRLDDLMSAVDTVVDDLRLIVE